MGRSRRHLAADVAAQRQVEGGRAGTPRAGTRRADLGGLGTWTPKVIGNQLKKINRACGGLNHGCFGLQSCFGCPSTWCEMYDRSIPSSSILRHTVPPKKTTRGARRGHAATACCPFLSMSNVWTPTAPIFGHVCPLRMIFSFRLFTSSLLGFHPSSPSFPWNTVATPGVPSGLRGGFHRGGGHRRPEWEGGLAGWAPKG